MNDASMRHPDVSEIHIYHLNAVEAADMYSKLSISEGFQELSADIYNDLGNAAEMICNKSPRIVIMGHTHEPILRQFYMPNWMSLYANTGFFCADIPRMNSKKEFLTLHEMLS